MFTESSEAQADILADLVSSQLQQRDTKPFLRAREMAHAYDRYLEDLWNGDPHAPVFCNWLTMYWRENLPENPTTKPDAISPHAAGGHGIHWYDTTDGVMGYVDGLKRGYLIPLTVTLPRW